jgi:hypothetical protein
MGKSTENVIPGAIRWDAWYGPSDANTEVEIALSPHRWHFRAPWFAKPTPSDSLVIDGGQQAIIDTEIQYAHAAGLRYWAYVWYGPDQPMEVAWRLHQSSTRRDDINWCLLLQVSNQGGGKGFAEATHEFITYMQQTNYQRVLNGRPLIYFLMDSPKTIERWGGFAGIGASLYKFRLNAQRVLSTNPYIVLLGGHPQDAADAAKISGCDAISTYVPIMKPGSPISWHDQEANVERLWAEYIATGVPMVVNCVTGWDQRPRLERSERRNIDSGSRHHESFDYTTRPTSDQLTGHLQAGVEFIREHLANCPSRAILIYSWDECDEGGNAIIPSYNPLGADSSVLAAVRRVNW